MKVYVCVELYKGLIHEARVFQKEESALKAERDWQNEHDVRNEQDREAKAQNGIEFHIFECETEP